MKITAISCSLREESRSRRLLAVTADRLAGRGHTLDTIDLRNLGGALPLCDAGMSYTDPRVADLRARIESADGVLLAFPIYNYDGSAAAKNLIELTGRAWTDKVVGLLASAGGRGSYMAPLGIAGPLLLDFQCTIVPRIVVVTEDAFDGDRLRDTFAGELLDDMLARFEKLAAAMG